MLKNIISNWTWKKRTVFKVQTFTNKLSYSNLNRCYTWYQSLFHGKSQINHKTKIIICEWKVYICAKTKDHPWHHVYIKKEPKWGFLQFGWNKNENENEKGKRDILTHFPYFHKPITIPLLVTNVNTILLTTLQLLIIFHY